MLELSTTLIADVFACKNLGPELYRYRFSLEGNPQKHGAIKP